MPRGRKRKIAEFVPPQWIPDSSSEEDPLADVHDLQPAQDPNQDLNLNGNIMHNI